MTNFPSTLFTFVSQPCSPQLFVEYWSQQYVYPDMHLYEDAIVGDGMTKVRLRSLFAWKNGMTLSEKKERALEEKIVSQVAVVRRLRSKFNHATFDEHFGKLTVVWQVFLLHIIDPEAYPIFDQHVYRAHRCLVDPKQVALDVEPKVTMAAYDEYQAFYREMVVRSGLPSKKVDDALWAFGKFLKRYPWIVVRQNRSASSSIC